LKFLNVEWDLMNTNPREPNTKPLRGEMIVEISDAQTNKTPHKKYLTIRGDFPGYIIIFAASRRIWIKQNPAF
jgi:hypothetical protein